MDKNRQDPEISSGSTGVLRYHANWVNQQNQVSFGRNNQV